MVQGLDRLNRKLKRTIPAHVKKAARVALETSAQGVVGTAKALAPKDSGDLANSIGYTFGHYQAENSNVRGVTAGAKSSADPDLSVTIHAGNAKAFYAAFVEFGTAAHIIRPKRPGGLLNIEGRPVLEVSHPGSAPTPFFFPAYRIHKRRTRSRINRAIRKALKDGAAS